MSTFESDRDSGRDDARFLRGWGTDVIAATAIALLDAFRLNHLGEVASISRRLLDELVERQESIQWDVFQNEAEQAYPEERPDRRLIDATSDPEVRRALWRWAAAHWDTIERGDLGHVLVALPPELVEPAVALDLVRFVQAMAGGFNEPMRAYLPCSDTLCRTDPVAAKAAMRLWRVLSPASPLSELVTDEWPESVAVPKDASQPVISPTVVVDELERGDETEAVGPQARGDALEVATREMLALLFDVGAEGVDIEVRRQQSGTQFGTDFKVRAPAIDSGSWCYVECKNYKSAPRPDDVGGKLLQTHTYLRSRPLDYWVLVSPHVDPSNDLDQLIEATNGQRTFSFAVQVWSPATGVQDLFRLVPKAFEAVYGHLPDTTPDARAVLSRFRNRLLPLRRLPPGLASYFDRPESFIVGDERRWLGDAAGLLPRTGADEAGELYPGDLRNRIISELLSDQPRTVLLLADFGEGKSCFTVTLCDHLRQRYRRDSGTHAFPLRLFLRDFRHADSAAAFLGQQLAKLGSSEAELDQLRSVARPIIVLDGLDEMSVRQDPKTLRNNLRKIGDLLDMLDGVSVLVTSRPQFFLTGHDRTLFEDRLRHPLVVHLQQLRRRDVVQHLRHHANALGLEGKLATVKNLYDPIGMAGKALYLDMLKATLPDLPDDHFDQKVLYETYVTKTFARKPGLLVDPDGRRTEAQILEDLLVLLEDIAVEVHRNGEGTVSLRDYFDRVGGAAHRLWRLSAVDDGADDDAAARVGSRSLLRRVADDDTWSVDFAHRSLKEYFVARALARATTAEDPFMALRALLKDLPVHGEVMDFYRLLVSVEDGADVLANVARSAGLAGGATIGAGALSLLHCIGGDLRGRNWSELGLDGAVLRNADLSGCDLRHSLLRNADLSSALLSDADLRDVDLTGSNLGVSDVIIGAAGDVRSACVYTLSDSGAISRISVGSRATVELGRIEMQGRPTGLAVVAEDLLCLTGEAKLVLARVDGAEVRPLASFLIRNDILRLDVLNDGTLAIVNRAENGAPDEDEGYRVTLIDLEDGQVVGERPYVDKAMSTVVGSRDAWATVSGEHLGFYRGGTHRKVQIGDERFESGLLRDRGNIADLLLGTDNGRLIHLVLDEGWNVKSRSSITVASGRIASIASDGAAIVAISTDGTVALGRWTPEGFDFEGDSFFRGVRAEGAQVSGVRSEVEREALLTGGAVDTANPLETQSEPIQRGRRLSRWSKGRPTSSEASDGRHPN